MKNNLQQTENQFNINIQIQDVQLNRTEIVQLKHTKHSFARSDQRGISNEKISVVIEYGTCIHKQGLVFYILGHNNIPAIHRKEVSKLKNIVVVSSGESNDVITCYKSNNPFKHVKIKSKFLNTNHSNVA